MVNSNWLDQKAFNIPSWAQIIVVGLCSIGLLALVPLVFRLTWLVLDLVNGTSTWL